MICNGNLTVYVLSDEAPSFTDLLSLKPAVTDTPAFADPLFFKQDTPCTPKQAHTCMHSHTQVMGRQSQEQHRFDEERGLTEPLLPDGTDEEVFGECARSDDLEVRP